MVRCTLPWTQLNIKPGDHVRVCCWAKRPLGKLEEFSTLESVWNGEAIRRFRQAMIKGNFDEICLPYCPFLIDGTYSLERFRSPNHEPNHPRRIIRTVIEAGGDQVPVPPLRIEASPDDQCALRCIMCSWNTGTYKIHPNFYLLVDEASPSLEELELLGGEPFYSRQVIEFLKHAKLHPPKYKFAFTTSLSHLPVSLLKDLRIAWMLVSIDGATKETYEAIRRGGHWENVLKNLSRLLKLRDEAKERFYIQVNFTIMSLNLREIPEAVRLFSSLNVPVAFYKVNVGPSDRRDCFRDPSQHEELGQALQAGLALSQFDATRKSLNGLLSILNQYKTPNGRKGHGDSR